MQANSKITELEAKLAELQQELTALQMQDKRMPIARDDPYDFLGYDSEPTSGQSSQKRKKGQVFPPAISYGGCFPSKASTLVLADEPMLMMLASSSQAVGSQTTLHFVHLPTRISRALKHKEAQAHASQPTPFVIPPGIMKELTSMRQTWLMNKAVYPPAVM